MYQNLLQQKVLLESNMISNFLTSVSEKRFGFAPDIQSIFWVGDKGSKS